MDKPADTNPEPSLDDAMLQVERQLAFTRNYQAANIVQQYVAAVAKKVKDLEDEIAALKAGVVEEVTPDEGC